MEIVRKGSCGPKKYAIAAYAEMQDAPAPKMRHTPPRRCSIDRSKPAIMSIISRGILIHPNISPIHAGHSPSYRLKMVENLVIAPFAIQMGAIQQRLTLSFCTYFWLRSESRFIAKNVEFLKGTNISCFGQIFAYLGVLRKLPWAHEQYG